MLEGVDGQEIVSFQIQARTGQNSSKQSRTGYFSEDDAYKIHCADFAAVANTNGSTRVELRWRPSTCITLDVFFK